MGDVRRVVGQWWKREDLDAAPPLEQRAAALALFEGAYAEERLAGILALAEHIGADLREDDLSSFARLFERGLLADWNLTDWCSIKVLAPMIERDPNPPTVARAIAAWRSADTLWQRRSACVAFVPLAKHGGASLPELPDLVEAAADTLVMDPERFAQTGVGWVMRELAKAEPARVLRFAERHLGHLSLEAIRSLGKGLADGEAKRLVAAKKGTERRPARRS